MLRGIIRSSLKLRFLAIIVAAVVILTGVLQFRQAPVDILPEFNQPYVQVQTESLGLDAQEVEQLITVPLEQDLLNGIPWLQSIRSDSIPGLSTITMIFEPGTDLNRARQSVAEHMVQAVALPHVSKFPVILQPLSSTSRVMIIGLSSKSLSLIQMSVLAHWTISPRLMGVPGVAEVAVWGLRDRQLQVQVNTDQMGEKGVSLAQVLETTGNALWVSSLSFLEASTPGTGGFIESANQRLGIRHILPIVSPQGLSQVPIEDTGVKLGDVANVVEDHQQLIGDALDNNNSSLLMVVEKFPGANTQDVTKGIEEALGELQPGLPGLTMDSTVYRPADFINLAVNNFARAALIGFLLTLLAIFLFSFDWRKVVISLIAIPVSLMAAGLVLYWTGSTINMVVITGLLIALGVVIEDSIVDVDHIVNRLRQARAEGSMQSTARIIYEASSEMRSSIIYAMLILLLAMSPIFLLSGIAGTFIRPLAIAYGLSILASMLVALFVTPSLSLILYANAPLQKRESPVAVWFKKIYQRSLPRYIERKNLAFMVAGIFTVIGLAFAPFLSASMAPAFKEQDLLVKMTAVPATSQSEMARITNRISREMRGVPGVHNVGVLIGRAILGDETVNMNSAELWVSIDPSVNYTQTVAAIRNVAGGYPGFQYTLTTYLNQVADTIVNTTNYKQITTRLYGDTDKDLQAQAAVVQKAIAGTPGVTATKIILPLEQPTLQTTVDITKAQQLGLKPGDVRRNVATLLSGLNVGSLFEDQKVFDVVVWSTPETRDSMSSIQDLPIDTPAGDTVRLGDIATVAIGPSPVDIKHDAVRRYIDIVSTVKGRNMAAVAADLQTRVSQINFPIEYHAEVLGNYADQQKEITTIVLFSIAMLFGILLLLQASFKSWRLAVVAILTLPMALSGGVVAAWIGGGVVSLGSLVGFLTILGLAVRNGIVVTSRYYHLQRHESQSFGPDLIQTGAVERVIPVLTTAFATAFAMLPALFMGDLPGLEIIRPMAVVILGGLVTTTLLDVFVLPALYLRYGECTEPEFDLDLTTSEQSASGDL